MTDAATERTRSVTTGLVEVVLYGIERAIRVRSCVVVRKTGKAGERAEQDIQRGHYGLARQRLTSYAFAKGYDADLAARIGQISFDMHDHFQAGRYWLLSSAEGDHVAEAIDVFLKHAGSAPEQIARNLPRVFRLASLEGYPEVVRGRLSRLGLEHAVTAEVRSENTAQRAMRRDRVAMIGCVPVAIILIAVFLIGLATVARWLFF